MTEVRGQKSAGRFRTFEQLKPFNKSLSNIAASWMTEQCDNQAYQTKTVSSYKELEALIAPLREDSEGLIFRGHASADWELFSRYERAQQKAEEVKGEKGRTAFGSAPHGPALGYAKRLLNVNSDNYDGQLWAQLQHYGVSTPLLDWTESVDVAMFFAFQFAPEPNAKHAAVFVADASKINQWADQLPDFYSPPLFVCPQGFFDARLSVQKGVFMMHGFYPGALEQAVDKITEPPCPTGALLKIEIPRLIHQRVSHELKNKGLTWNKLFPRSMDDVCREVEQRVLKHLYEPDEPDDSFVLSWDDEQKKYVENKND